MTQIPRCICCDDIAQYNVLLAYDETEPVKTRRYYLPNQFARDIDGPYPVYPVWFCSSCMKHLEQNMRETIFYLQNQQRTSYD